MPEVSRFTVPATNPKDDEGPPEVLATATSNIGKDRPTAVPQTNCTSFFGLWSLGLGRGRLQ